MNVLEELDEFFPIVDSMETLEKEYGFDPSDLDKNDWYQISKLELSEEFMQQYEDKIDWEEHFMQWEIDESIIRKYAKHVKIHRAWESISYQKGLSKEFILDFADKLDPTIIVEYQEIPLKLVGIWSRDKKNSDLVFKALEYQRITSKLLNLLIKRNFEIDWRKLSREGNVTDTALIEHRNKVHWSVISKERVLSEKQIESFNSYLDWELISQYQKMSIEFIIKMSNYIDIDALKENKVINQEELYEKEVYTLLKLAQ